MKNFRNIILIAMSVVLFGTIMRISKQHKQIDLLEANELAYQDSLHSAQVKIGESGKQTVYWQQAFVDKADELDISKKEIKELEKKLDSKLAYIAELQTNVRVDTIKVYNKEIQYVDSTGSVVAYFESDDKWFGISGTTYVNGKQVKTELHDISVPAPLTVGITKDNKISITTPNPYINIENIHGTTTKYFDYKQPKKRWHLGITGGFGAMYGLSHKQLDWGPTVGLGLTYNIF